MPCSTRDRRARHGCVEHLRAARPRPAPPAPGCSRGSRCSCRRRPSRARARRGCRRRLRVTACTAAVFVTIVNTTSLALGDLARAVGPRAPASSSGSAFSRVRFQTVTVVAGVEQPTDDARSPSRRDRRSRAQPCATPFSTSDWTRARCGEHLRARTLGVASGDRSADRAMLDHRALGAPRDHEDRESARAAARRAPRACCAARAGSRRLRDREVEAEVGVDEVVAAAGLASAACHRPRRGVHLGEVLVPVPLGGERGRLAIEDPAELEEVVRRRSARRA